MPADRLLETLLRSLQTYTDQQDTPRQAKLLSTAASLLANLTNPLNVTLLTSQLQNAPALWALPEGLRLCLRFMSVFHSATITVLHRDDNAKEQSQSYPGPPPPPKLSLDAWIKAVVKGADERSLRWKHVLVIGGLLIGLENKHEDAIRNQKAILRPALVQAANLALAELEDADELGAYCLSLALNHTFPLLWDEDRALLDYDRLLPVLTKSTFFSSEGFQSAYFLSIIDLDVIEVKDKKFSWPAKSSSFYQLDQLTSRPLMASMGPLSRLLSHTVESTSSPWLVQKLSDDLTHFTRSLLTQWRQNKLSEVDASEESLFLDQESLERTLPVLWKLLRSALFATTIVLRGIMGRLLAEGKLAADAAAPLIVSQTLHTLRNLYFITSRLGSTSFTQYNFVYLTALDVLTQYPIQADSFIREIRPITLGTIPSHPLDRCLDLYFLNTAEHLPLVLSSNVTEELLVAAATPYLASGGDNNLLPIFEAAHSVMLSVFSAPQNAPLASKHLPFYVDALFKVFPKNLSARQFRLAFRTLISVTTPPSPLSNVEPELPSILLEIVRHHATTASATPLPNRPVADSGGFDGPQLSEQAVLVLTLLDSLSSLPVDILEEWLYHSAELMQLVADEGMRTACRNRFWELLISGEMDPERSELCVTWWGTRGGKELVLFGQTQKPQYVMSGAIPAGERENKL